MTTPSPLAYELPDLALPRHPLPPAGQWPGTAVSDRGARKQNALVGEPRGEATDGGQVGPARIGSDLSSDASGPADGVGQASQRRPRRVALG